MSERKYKKETAKWDFTSTDEDGIRSTSRRTTDTDDPRRSPTLEFPGKQKEKQNKEHYHMHIYIDYVFDLKMRPNMSQYLPVMSVYKHASGRMGKRTKEKWGDMNHRRDCWNGWKTKKRKLRGDNKKKTAVAWSFRFHSRWCNYDKWYNSILFFKERAHRLRLAIKETRIFGRWKHLLTRSF